MYSPMSTQAIASVAPEAFKLYSFPNDADADGAELENTP